jgi:hypothetical protein
VFPIGDDKTAAGLDRLVGDQSRTLGLDFRDVAAHQVEIGGVQQHARRAHFERDLGKRFADQPRQKLMRALDLVADHTACYFKCKRGDGLLDRAFEGRQRPAEHTGDRHEPPSLFGNFRSSGRSPFRQSRGETLFAAFGETALQPFGARLNEFRGKRFRPVLFILVGSIRGRRCNRLGDRAWDWLDIGRGGRSVDQTVTGVLVIARERGELEGEHRCPRNIEPGGHRLSGSQRARV